MFGLALCAGAGITSCSSDLDDPMDTIPYNRVLTPMNFEAEVIASKGTDITFKWSAVQNATSYVLEIFEAVETIETDDSGNESTVYSAPDYDNVVAYLSIEVDPDEIPYTVTDLEVDKSFFARVRGVNASIKSSYWAYLDEEVSTSAVRALLNPFIVERTTSTVTVGWDDADDKTDLTSIRVIPVVPAEGEAARTIALTDEQKENCEVEVDGLDACRNYKFTLLFGKSGSRGVVTAWTRPSIDGLQSIASQEALIAALSGASGDLKLSLAYNDGAVYDLSDLMTINASEGIYDPFEFAYGLEIYGESTATGERPVVKGAVKLMPGATKLHIEDIYVDGGNVCGVFVTTGTVTDKDAGTTTGCELAYAEFVNCEICGFTKGIWSGAAGCNVTGNLLYDSVYAHDINNQVKSGNANGGDFIDIRGGDYGKVEVKNSTFYSCARTFLRASDSALTIGSINIENCTFNQVTCTHTSNNNAGFFHVRHSSGTKISESFTMTKCVVMNIFAEEETASAYWCRLTRQSAENYAPTCSGNIFYNVGNNWDDLSLDCSSTFFYNLKSVQLDGTTVMTEALALADSGMILDEDPCSNSIAGKMYLTNGAISANKAGDPRWWDATEPVVVRETALTAVTEPTEWDFTEKTKFVSETIETNQIIENIRIYAPAEVVMGEGVTFSSAATVASTGRPSASALGFLAAGVGAVEVTTVDAGFNASIEIIADGDRYSILADGKTHKVVLGDLVGENDIYILPGAPVTITKVAWTDDLTPEATVAALDAPKPTVDNASFDEGSSVAVTVSWAAVENADSYAVTFNNSTVETTETQYVIDAATVSTLAVGEYEISVVAKPVATSSKYTASEAGVATFKVKKVIVAGIATVTWDFTTFDGTNLEGETWTNNVAFVGDVVWTVNEKFPMTIMNGVTVQSGSNGAKTGDGSSYLTSAPTRRALYFTAGAPGTLKYTVKSGNSSDARPTYVAVSDANGVYKLVYTSPEAITEATYEVDLTDLVGDETIYIFGKGNNFSKVEWSYADPDAGAEKELVWDCMDSSFDAIGAAMGTDGSLTATIPDLVWNGLTILTGSKTKYGTSTVDGVDYRYIQWGGSGKANGDRSCYFTAPASGTLTVMASNTGSSTDTARLVAVSVNGEVYTQIGGTPTSAPTTVTFDIDIDEATTVYVYPSGNGLRFYSMKYTYVE